MGAATMRLGVGLACAALAQPARQPAEPPALHLESLAFDAARGRLVLFGGAAPAPSGPLVEPGETWEWDGTAWRVAIPADQGPGRRRGHAMAWDAVGARVVLHGGVRERAGGTSGEEALCDTWHYAGGRWARAADGPCLVRVALASGTVGGRSATLLLGAPAPAAFAERRLHLWRWDAGAWRLVDSTTGPRTGGPIPVALDASRGVLVAPVLAGADAGVWEWDGARWRRVPHDGGPSARDRHALAYDEARRRVVLVGGRSVGTPDRSFVADAWSWDGARWSALAASDSAPGPRAASTLVAAGGGRLLYHGGTATGRGLLRELWALDGDRWALAWSPAGR